MMSGEGSLVRDVMKKNVITIDASDSIALAAKKMDEANIGSVIITKNNEPVGIITERDFVRRILAKEKKLDNPVSDVMSSPLISLKSDETVWNAAELMKKKNIHKLVVIEDSKLVGIVTNSDLVELASVGSDSEMRKICDQILLRMQK